MGCDIHFYVERRVDGVWITADKWTKAQYESEGDTLRVNYSDSFYHERNYNLFAILADVRNGRGFAGVPTGEGFNPIASPKGIPEDACVEYLKEVERWDGDGHSHSYFTVAELMAYDWTQTSTLFGQVELSEWARWKTYGEPESWAGAIGSPNIRHYSAEQMDAYWNAYRKQAKLADTTKPWYIFGRPVVEGMKLTHEEAFRNLVCGPLISPVVAVTWNRTYYECAQRFLGLILPRLWRLGAPEDVRICFFFDN